MKYIVINTLYVLQNRGALLQLSSSVFLIRGQVRPSQLLVDILEAASVTDRTTNPPAIGASQADRISQ